jgi:hypothetical protein
MGIENRSDGCGGAFLAATEGFAFAGRRLWTELTVALKPDEQSHSLPADSEGGIDASPLDRIERIAVCSGAANALLQRRSDGVGRFAAFAVRVFTHPKNWGRRMRLNEHHHRPR